MLPDGSGVHLRWEVDADPESYLALDWEHRNGIRLVECQQGRLVLAVPPAHSHRVKRWQLVTSSSDRHGCQHLADRDLYHRVLRVDARGPVGDMEAITLATEELASPSQLFPHCNFALTLAPPAGIASGAVGGRARRLQAPEQAMTEVEDELQGMAPKDNYHGTWNYSFSAPPLRENVSLYAPGASGFLKLDVPTLEAKVGLVLNFSSQLNDDHKPSKAHFVGQLDLHLNIDAYLATAINAEDGSKPRVLPPIDFDNLLSLPLQFGTLKFFLGPIPVTIAPSFDSLQLGVVHDGILKSSFQAAFKTDLSLSLLAEFDMHKGLQVNVSSSAKDSKFLPPVVMLSAQNFKLDLALIANASIKPFFNASISPAFNLSITTPQIPTLPPLATPTLPPLPGVPDPNCHPQDFVVGVDISVKASMSLMPSLDLLSESVSGPLNKFLPDTVCMTGACQGMPPNCKVPAVSPLQINSIVVRISRSYGSDIFDPELSEQVAFGLSLLPSAVQVITGVLGNSTEEDLLLEDIEQRMNESSGNLIRDLEGGLEAAERKGLHEADSGLNLGAKEFLSPTERRLAAAAGPKERKEYTTFVVRVEESRYELSDEFLQSLARGGAFRIRDGRERELGGIRVTGIRALRPKAEPAPGQQQLWGQSPAVAGAAAGGMGERLAASALAAAAFIGLGALFAIRRRREYGTVPAVGAVE